MSSKNIFCSQNVSITTGQNLICRDISEWKENFIWAQILYSETMNSFTDHTKTLLDNYNPWLNLE